MGAKYRCKLLHVLKKGVEAAHDQASNMKTKTFLALFLLAFLLLTHAAAQQIQHSEIQIEPKAFDEFVGEYRFADNRDTLVAAFREGDKFFMQIAGSSGKV